MTQVEQQGKFPKECRGGTPDQNCFYQHFLRGSHNGFMNNCETIFIDKTDSSHPTRMEFFWMMVLKYQPHCVLILMKVTIINFYPQLISISACDMLWISDHYLLVLMLKVSLSLVYHAISVTYVQLLTITSSFCTNNCKKYLTVI